MPVTTIDENNGVCTLINVFTIEPERQGELLEALAQASEDVMKNQPGFVSANIHASLDGTRVVNYAQWESKEHFQAMLADPVCQEHMKAIGRLASAQPSLYTVESVHHR